MSNTAAKRKQQLFFNDIIIFETWLNLNALIGIQIYIYYNNNNMSIRFYHAFESAEKTVGIIWI